MILHPDGRVEGTPGEVAAYKLLLANDARQTLAAGEKVQLVEAKPEREVQYTAAKRAEMQRQTELTEEQVSSLSTHRLVEELRRRTGVKHIPINRSFLVNISTTGQDSADTFGPDQTGGFRYIIIERDNPAN